MKEAKLKLKVGGGGGGGGRSNISLGRGLTFANQNVERKPCQCRHP